MEAAPPPLAIPVRRLRATLRAVLRAVEEGQEVPAGGLQADPDHGAPPLGGHLGGPFLGLGGPYRETPGTREKRDTPRAPLGGPSA